jgi:hypothetical protein
MEHANVADLAKKLISFLSIIEVRVRASLQFLCLFNIFFEDFCFYLTS